ncbi:serine peptidase [Amycolatopsis sp. NPDC058278]|uniref:serine peptidase n=1 Tax=Amycolatopsis sp. NPDC058278 TaxID=3346417 RepID=UPI0036D958D0
MRRVVGVHGIGNYESGSPSDAAAALTERWRANLPGVDLLVSYYAHHLRRGTSHGDGHLEPEAQEMFVAWVDQLRGQPAFAHGERTAGVRAAADWLTRHFGEAVRLLAMAFCREVHTYLRKPDSPRRLAARQTVAEAIGAHRPDVVVAHSLGSVVAYETLWAHQDHDVDLLVTLGSPLAMPSVVFPRLLPDRASKPPRVRRWVNIADVGDIVAIPRTGLSGYFVGVERDVDVVIGKNDFHTVASYLRCPEVAAVISSS